MKDTLRLIRPAQWIKNLFVFLPMFFGGRLTDGAELLDSFIVFASFSLVASSIYCLNDLVDLEADRRHPVKCHRPIASGAVSVATARAMMAMLVVAALAVLLLLHEERWPVMAVVTFYWLLNVAYCLKLKQYAVLDVCIIAFGFVLRILAGGVATDTGLSRWIVLMTFLVTLFMSFAKRRDDVLRMEQTGEAPRKNTGRYNLTFINQAITITASVTLVCYIMYTVSPDVLANFRTDYLYLTSIFVLLGLLRYIQIAVVDRKSGDPTKIALHDHPTQLIIAGWLLTFLIIIYL